MWRGDVTGAGERGAPPMTDMRCKQQFLWFNILHVSPPPVFCPSQPSPSLAGHESPTIQVSRSAQYLNPSILTHISYSHIAYSILNACADSLTSHPTSPVHSHQQNGHFSISSSKQTEADVKRPPTERYISMFYEQLLCCTLLIVEKVARSAI